MLLLGATCADVLPDDRADLFYREIQRWRHGHHRGVGAGTQENHRDIRAKPNYFVDKVTGASIDVLSQASQINDERKQKSGTVEYVHDKTTYTASYINSGRQTTPIPKHLLETGHVR